MKALWQKVVIAAKTATRDPRTETQQFRALRDRYPNVSDWLLIYILESN